MPEKVNRETATRTDVVDRRISIAIVGETHTFVLSLPRYIDEKIDADAWTAIGTQLRSRKDDLLRAMVANGSYFRPNGRTVLYVAVEDAAREFVYRHFRDVQARAGNLAWAVPSTLQGEFYKP